MDASERLFVAVESEDPAAVANAIAAGASVTARDEEGETPLHRAASAGRLKVLLELLHAGAPVDVANPSLGFARPLDRAAYHGHVEVVRALLDAGADPTARNESGRTALHDAACVGLGTPAGHAETVRVLVAAGADVNARTQEGSTPLHSAALSADGSVVASALLALGADATIANADGNLALHHAGAIGNAESCRLLLDAGANPNAKTKEGWTVLDGVVGLAASFQDDPDELARYERTYELVEARGGKESGLMRTGASPSGCLGGLLAILAALIALSALI